MRIGGTWRSLRSSRSTQRSVGGGWQRGQGFYGGAGVGAGREGGGLGEAGICMHASSAASSQSKRSQSVHAIQVVAVPDPTMSG
eukprot:364798-Chlamydomonas_euryale.AAC.13